MIVAGGLYLEKCEFPPVSEYFGSGGRAAVALASLAPGVTLYTYCPLASQADITASLQIPGLEFAFSDSSHLTTFRYLHPMSRPGQIPFPAQQHPPISVQGKSILRFGMVEGEAIITAEKAVYDPQSPNPVPFDLNGSTAGHLAIVMNSRELIASLGHEGIEGDAVRKITQEQGARVVVSKAGAMGARVYFDGVLQGTVPPYQTERVYKIGSGDMFCAAFAHAWCRLDLDPLGAADYASRSAARYCETRSSNLVPPAQLTNRVAASPKQTKKVYIAGPFFSVGDLWMIEEAWRALTDLGAQTFSPYHEVGIGSANYVAAADLKQLDEAGVVLAITTHSDPGTLFEIGYATSKKIPVIILHQNGRRTDNTMMEGTGSFITDDLATAVYRAAWASWE